ncbi:hypothetical protein [Tepidibacillus decaturensis]|uniref:Uncharacterized protein n=1 Tax=Tepidibacillus decaturensis TaxID=1413211 RepID=A0A135L3P6_9BACI|nr:hypothetical protein [Tepidibacillus decaturensis]KXG43527.1 hypothetical protein U473_05480 [Tepidibacillus decaturensis]
MDRTKQKVVCDLSWCQLNFWFDEDGVGQVLLIDKKDPSMNIETTVVWFVSKFLRSAAFILTNIPEIDEFRKWVLRGKKALEEYYDTLPEVK